MYGPFKPVALLLGAAALLAIAACGGATSTTTTIMTDGDSEFGFGEPSDPADADRITEITASDDLTFNPSELTVAQGETVTFRVINKGKIPHEFILGDEATQDEHEEAMSEKGGMTMHDEPNAIVVAAGETKEITWRFAEAGTVIFGCHEPGHYAAGMRGQVVVGS